MSSNNLKTQSATAGLKNGNKKDDDSLESILPASVREASAATRGVSLARLRRGQGARAESESSSPLSTPQPQTLSVHTLKNRALSASLGLTMDMANRLSPTALSLMRADRARRLAREHIQDPRSHIERLASFKAYLRRIYVFEKNATERNLDALWEFVHGKYQFLVEAQDDGMLLTSSDMAFLQELDRGAYLFKRIARPKSYADRDKAFTAILTPWLPESKYYLVAAGDTDIDLTEVTDLSLDPPERVKRQSEVMIPTPVQRRLESSGSRPGSDGALTYAEVLERDVTPVPVPVDPERQRIRLSLDYQNPNVVAAITRELFIKERISIADARCRILGEQEDRRYNIERANLFRPRHLRVLRYFGSLRAERYRRLVRDYHAKFEDKWLLTVNGSWELLDRVSTGVHKKVLDRYVRNADLVLVPRRHPPERMRVSSSLGEFLCSSRFLPFAGRVFSNVVDLFDFMDLPSEYDRIFAGSALASIASDLLPRDVCLYILQDVLHYGWIKLGHDYGRSVFRDFVGVPSSRVRFSALGVVSHIRRTDNRFSRVVGDLLDAGFFRMADASPPGRTPANSGDSWGSSDGDQQLVASALRVSREFVYQGDVREDFLSGFTENAPILVDILSVLLLTQEIQTWKGWLALLGPMISRVPFPASVVSYLLSLVGSVGSRFNYEGSFASALMKSDIFAAATDLASAISVAGVFSMLSIPFFDTTVKNWKSMVARILRSDKDMNVDVFGDRVFAFLRVCLERVKRCIVNKDFSCLFEDTPSFSDWMKWTDALLNDEAIRFDPGRPEMSRIFLERKKQGFYPPRVISQLDVHARISIVMEMIAIQPRVAEFSPKDDFFVKASFRNRMDALRNEERSLVAQQANSAYRIVPFGIFIYGKPGAGKTKLVSRLHGALGASMSMLNDETTMYRIDPTSARHDTFFQSMWSLLMDDIDQSQAPLTASVPTHVEIVNKMINSAPFPMEKADLPDKGKFFANFITAFFVTNFSNGNIQGKTTVPLQFWRRFPFRIDVAVKSEFANAAGGLDMDKVVVDAAMLNFTVMKYSPTREAEHDTHKIPYVTLFVTDSEPRVTRFLVEKLREHLVAERAMLDTRSLERMGDVCPFCFLPLTAHRDPCSQQSYESALVQVAGVLAWAWLIGKFLVEPVHTAFLARVTRYSLAIHILSVFGWMAFGLSIMETLASSFSLNLHRWVLWFRLIVIAQHAKWCDYLSQEGMRRIKERLSSPAVLKVLISTISATVLGYSLWKSLKRDERQEGLLEAPDSVPKLPERRDPWLRVPPTLWSQPYAERVKPTHSVQEMIRVLQSRIVDVSRDGLHMHGIMIRGGVMLVPKHLFLLNSTVKSIDVRPFIKGPTDFRVYSGLPPHGRWIDLRLSEADCIYVPGRDIVVARVIEIPVVSSKWDLFEEIPPTCLATSHARADKAWLVGRDEVRESTARLEGTPGYMEREGAGSWTSASLATSPGDCGLPMVAVFGDRFYIVGFHGSRATDTLLGGLPVRSFSVAESFSRAELNPSVSVVSRRLGSTFEIVFDPKTVDPTIESLTFTDLPPKSSLGVAVTREANFQGLIFGTISQDSKRMIGGVSMATSILPTVFIHDPVVVEETAKCFEGDDAFAVPRFAGRMRDDGWWDPHVRSLGTYLNKPGDSNLWLAAVGDYVDGCDHLSGWRDIVPLSVYSALIGIDATTVGSFNLKTSAGLPFVGNKKTCVFVDREGPVPELFLNPQLLSQVDRILEVVDGGDLYSPIAVHCLKDEVVTRLKNEAGKVRVFNIMSFAFNLLLKMYVGPIVAIFREHPLFFESAIGLNIAGVKDATMMWNHLSAFDNWTASDVSNFDTTASTQELYYSSLVVMSVARSSGYNPISLKRLWGLLLSSIHVTHIVKGDAFFVNFTLASGYWVTLFLNCIRNSLHSRYAFYALRPQGSSHRFRDVVRQFVLGDDNISTVSPLVPWYNQVDVARVVEEIGSKRSSCRKTPVLSPYEEVSDVSFLKRTPSLCEGRRVWSIEEKTLWRMLCYRRRGDLSAHDHHAVILSTVLAEAWMYGRERFEFFRNLTLRLAEENDLRGSFVLIPTFEDFLRRYDAGTLTVWDPFSDEQL